MDQKAPTVGLSCLTSLPPAPGRFNEATLRQAREGGPPWMLRSFQVALRRCMRDADGGHRLLLLLPLLCVERGLPEDSLICRSMSRISSKGEQRGAPAGRRRRWLLRPGAFESWGFPLPPAPVGTEQLRRGSLSGGTIEVDEPDGVVTGNNSGEPAGGGGDGGSFCEMIRGKGRSGAASCSETSSKSLQTWEAAQSRTESPSNESPNSGVESRRGWRSMDGSSSRQVLHALAPPSLAGALISPVTRATCFLPRIACSARALV